MLVVKLPGKKKYDFMNITRASPKKKSSLFLLKNDVSQKLIYDNTTGRLLINKEET